MRLTFLRIFARSEAGGLCSTCSWGTVRKGFYSGQVEVFCRLVGPANRVPFAVRECNDYCDRRLTTETSASGRRYGFIAELTLDDHSELHLTTSQT